MYLSQYISTHRTKFVIIFVLVHILPSVMMKRPRVIYQTPVLDTPGPSSPAPPRRADWMETNTGFIESELLYKRVLNCSVDTC